MRLFVLIFAILCVWLKLAMGVIQDGVMSWEPVPGALRYTVWRVLPGSTRFELMASVTTNRFQPVPSPDYTTFYVRTISPTNINGFIGYHESEFGEVMTPPVAHGTNRIRWVVQNPRLILQGAAGAAGPWADLADLTNTNLPVHLTIEQKQMFRVKQLTNGPPPLP